MAGATSRAGKSSSVPQSDVPGIPLVDIANSIPVSALTLSRCDPNYVSDWHPAPRRQFVFIVEGGLARPHLQARRTRLAAGIQVGSCFRKRVPRALDLRPRNAPEARRVSGGR